MILKIDKVENADPIVDRLTVVNGYIYLLQRGYIQDLGDFLDLHAAVDAQNDQDPAQSIYESRAIEFKVGFYAKLDKYHSEKAKLNAELKELGY